MLDFKKEIVNSIAEAVKMNKDELESFIEIPKDSLNGDYAFPCFKLAKVLRKSPTLIAEDIKENVNLDKNLIQKVENVSMQIKQMK